MDAFTASFERLNPQQREAVECIDGPLMVIAGPGTGKTQLLSLRAANILAHRDIQPQNILCLTYTEAGAEAMTKRLIELIGRDGYNIEVSTFHAFACACRNKYSEYFREKSRTVLISSLQQNKLIDKLLKDLRYDNCLAGISNGIANNIGAVKTFISTMKRHAISPQEYKAIMQQTHDSGLYLAHNPTFMELLTLPLNKKDKYDIIQSFQEQAYMLCKTAPKELTDYVCSVPGVYEPYLCWLIRYLDNHELTDSTSTSGFQELRKVLFRKDANHNIELKCMSASEKGLVAADIYAQYQQHLEQSGLHDYDDMIMDFLTVVRATPELKYALQEQYRYIQVDEFQDTNSAQMGIVELLADGVEKPNIMVVGDDDQAIMRFQGASIACIGQFCARFGPKRVVLKTNYRSTPDIVAMGSRIAQYIEQRLPESTQDKQIEAFREHGTQTSFEEQVFLSEDQEYFAIAQDIKRHIDDNFIENAKKPDEAIAVIANTHKMLKKLIPFLNKFDIPYSYSNKANVFTMESLQTTLALLRCVSAYSAGKEDLAATYLPQIVASPEWGGDNVSSIMFALNAKKHYRGNWLRALKETDNKRLQELHNLLQEWSRRALEAPVRQLIFDITAKSRLYYQRHSEDNPYALAEYNSGIRALLLFVNDELESRYASQRALRLSDIVHCMDEAASYSVFVEASLQVGTQHAVRLTSAHSSKGLEFDLVYLIDAADKTWYSTQAGKGVCLFPDNILVSNDKNDDDVRRLLFVAVTRAKDYLKISRVGGNTLPEINELVTSTDITLDVQDVSAALQTSWEQSYELNSPELRALLTPYLPPRALSVSALNDFVSCTGCSPENLGSACFAHKRLLALPQAPSISLEFGSLVHAYFEDYVQYANKYGLDAVDKELRTLLSTDALQELRAYCMNNDTLENMSVQDAAQTPLPLQATTDKDDAGAANQSDNIYSLISYYINRVAALDFEREDVIRCLDRFIAIVHITPEIARGYSNQCLLRTEVELTAVVNNEVPLYGKCDLLQINEQDKTIKLIDYKTSLSTKKITTPTAAYQRQLQFYVYLIENSQEFSGYHVITCEDWYVEPDKQTKQKREPVVSSASRDELAHLTQLIVAAWHRITNANFDTSAFFESSQFVTWKEKYSDKKKMSQDMKNELQRCYEDWLISEDDVL